MILLDTSAKSISVSLAGAVTTNELQCVASYTDITRKYSGQQGSLNSYVPFTIVNSFAVENDTLTNGASLVTLVNPPAASDDVWIYSHEVDSISIYNADTASATVTVWLDGASNRVIIKCTLAVGYTLHYESGKGWYTLNTSGAVASFVTSSTTVPDGTYGDITVSSSGTVWTLIASISKAITGTWSFETAKLRLYNAASTFYGSLANAFTANRTITFPDKDFTVAGIDDVYFTIETITGSIAAPVDATTYYIGLFGPVTASTTASLNDFNIGYPLVLIGAVIQSFNNTIQGSNEDSTLKLRNTTQATSSTIGTFKTDNSGTRKTYTYTGLNIAVAATDNICLEWLTPSWSTNPTAPIVRVLLIFKRA